MLATYINNRRDILGAMQDIQVRHGCLLLARSTHFTTEGKWLLTLDTRQLPKLPFVATKLLLIRSLSWTALQYTKEPFDIIECAINYSSFLLMQKSTSIIIAPIRT